MTKKLLQKFKQKLEGERALIEDELRRFAKKDVKPTGDWDTRFPHWNGEAGSAGLEKAADEVEEYSTRLPIEYNLETRLRDINLALEKIKRGRYGICEKCKRAISKERLEVYPEARFCLKCKTR